MFAPREEKNAKRIDFFEVLHYNETVNDEKIETDR